jgi:hypothetical protein
VDVDLCGNGITKEGAGPLALGVQKSSSLAAIALDNNDLQEDGGKAMLKVWYTCGVEQGHPPVIVSAQMPRAAVTTRCSRSQPFELAFHCMHDCYALAGT